jgi:uncharacterized protein YyaL (SSP411 family)
MTSSDGGFYSAEDADSNGVEGGFYVWTIDEVRRALPNQDFDLACLYYDITTSGNFHSKNVLNTKESIEEFCEKYHFDPEELESRLSEIKNILLHRFREDEAQFNGNLEDYAFMIKGLISLFEATFDPNYLKWSIAFSNILESQFAIGTGGYYQADGSDPNLIVRKAQFADGAEPSGNSIQGENLLRLYQITRDETWLKHAEDLFRTVNKHLGTYSPGYTQHVMNLLRFYDLNAPTFVISVGDDGHLEQILNKIYSEFFPHKAVIVFKGEKELLEILPYLSEYPPLDNKTTLYLCTQNHCKEPSNDLNKILELIDKA